MCRENSKTTRAGRPRLLMSAWSHVQCQVRCGLTLEIALLCLGVTREGRLRLLVLQLVQDLLVRDVTDLEVFLDQSAILVADAAFAFRHHGVAGVIRLAYIAVDASPAVITLAFLLTSSR
jgi:hypothetical protein